MAYPHWTTNVLKAAPAAAANVSVTPSGTAFANSAWVEVLASAAADLLLAGIVVDPGVASVDFQVEVGKGTAGSETVVAAFAGMTSFGPTLTGSLQVLLPILVDNIPSGARVAIRMRKTGTNATAWGFAVQFYEKPITGTLATTAKPSKVMPNAAAGANAVTGTALYANGAYVQITASTSAALVLLGAVVMVAANAVSWELDIATGAAGSETVITTFRGRQNGFADAPHWIPLAAPLDAIGSGVRVSARGRRDDGTNSVANTLKVYLVYMEKPL